jgi:four helix bundle protein
MAITHPPLAFSPYRIVAPSSYRKLYVNKNKLKKIGTHKDLRVYQLSFEAGMEVYKISKLFPKEEMYSLTDQIRRSSRSVSGNIAEAFRKRRYPKSFIAKLTDSEGEAAETQVWLDYALACNYLDKEQHVILFDKYDHIIAMLVNMINKPDNWTL